MTVRPGYTEARPSTLTKPQIQDFAERVGQTFAYNPGEDIAPLVKRLGGKISIQDTLESDPENSGSLYVERPGQFEIIIPTHTSILRDRFTVAHELGHYFIHYLFMKGVDPSIPDRVVALRKGSTRIEWEANWFAAGLLMPEQVFRRVFQQNRADVSVIASLFQVSTRAIEVRAKDLRLA